jgi:uncharacterized protein (DUF302 family)
MIANLTVSMSGDFEAAIEHVTAALKEQGFGVLTRIDLDKAFEEKLGKTFRRYVLLGACNPHLAHTAVTAQPEVGLLLPCNVTVEQDGGAIRVRFVDPVGMMASAGLDSVPAIIEHGKDAKARFARASSALA